MAKLTRPDLSWLSYLAERPCMYNPYTAPGAQARWKRRAARWIRAGLVIHEERNAYDALRGGVYAITDAGREALAQSQG